MAEPTFFATPAAFRRWLDKHHATERELLVGFYKSSTGRPSITWPEARDEALCVGWIDGVRKGRDADSYTIRFTPRKRRSIWSAVNVKRVEALTREGRMTPAGLAAFEARSDRRTGIYSHEQRDAASLTPAQERRFKSNRPAWAWFRAQAPSYRKTAIWWVVSAKREDTRERRLGILIADSEAGRRVPPLTRPGTAAR
jgi:uncharacterized protein YdeI (YjbR/CyaY-like superfamily)